MKYYKCSACNWATELETRVPANCGRCTAQDVQEITGKDFAAMVVSHEVVYCKPCGRYHTR